MRPAPSPDFEKGIATVGGYGEKVEDPEKLIPAHPAAVCRQRLWDKLR
jgi:hypothetical protein